MPQVVTAVAADSSFFSFLVPFRRLALSGTCSSSGSCVCQIRALLADLRSLGPPPRGSDSPSKGLYLDVLLSARHRKD